jgi:hypothetical protein
MRGAQQVCSSMSGFSRKPHSGFLAVIHSKELKMKFVFRKMISNCLQLFA